jgi:hypothetical protein
MGKPMTRCLTSLALLVACGLGAQDDANPVLHRRSLPARTGPHAIKGHDLPDLRHAWDLYWFGGELSPDYMDYKNRMAAQEVQRWRALFPKAQGEAILPTPPGVGGVTWTNLGPTSNLVNATWSSIDSGRPVAIVPHPTVATTLYLATSGGGIFKCTNADITQAAADWIWTPITDDLPASGSSGNVSIGAMASPDGTTLFVGLGDPFDAQGRGFFTSPDGGTTWTAATGLGNQTRSYSILPLTVSKIFWGTNDGLKVSNDGGATFAAVTGGPATGQAWTVRKVTTTDIVCSIQPTTGAGAIYTSADSGATWNLASISGVPAGVTPGRITVAVAGDGTTAYAMIEDTTSGNIARGVLKSVDKGHTWTWQAAPTIAGGLFQGTGPQMTGDGGQGFYNHGIGVDPTNPARLVVGANLALYRSLDGGLSWTQLTHWYGSGHPYTHADNHATAWSSGTLFVANDGGLAILKDPWRSTVPTTTDDLTFIDNRRNKGLTSHLVYNVGSTLAAAPADSKWRISLGLQDNGTRVRQPNTTGGTLTGTEGTFEDGIGGDGFGTQIHPTDGTQMLGSVYYTDIWKSTNGGTTFTESISGITEANSSTLAPFAPKIALGATATPNTVYTAVNAKVYASTNFGSSWTAMAMTGYDTTRLLRNVNGSRSSSAVGAASSGGHFWTTYNNGAAWTDSGDITGGTFNTSYIWFNTENDQIVYGSTVAPTATAHHLFKSANGGATWTSIDGSATTSNGLPFGIPVHVIQNLPGSINTLFAGTDFGVYRSTDGGANWARFGNGLPMVASRDLYIAPNGTFIRAGTYGRGVWEIPTVASTGPAVTLVPTSATLVNGGTQGFTPTVSNGTLNTVTWSASAGTIAAGPTATGVAQTYTAPATGTAATVTATTVDTPAASAQAAITLVAPAAVTVTVSPATAELMTGSGTQQFTGAVSPLTNSSVTWSGSGVSALGLFSATGLAAGPYTVTATSQAAPSRSGTATVTLLAPSSISVSVAPATSTLFAGGVQTFTATVTGPTLTANKTVTWSTNGGGTITAGGVFTATTVGSFTITATNTFSGVTGTAAITVSAAKSLDLNGDGTVDLLDLLTFAKYYGTTNAGSDLNGDGTVNDADLALLLAGL